MGTFSEQFLKQGVVSKEKHDKVEAEKRQRESTVISQDIHKLTTKSHRPVNLDRLETCNTVNEFKDTAKKLLGEHPELIDEVVNNAHRLQNASGGKKLVWLAYKVKEGLQVVKNDKRSQFLKRALRKSGANVEIPKEWRK